MCIVAGHRFNRSHLFSGAKHCEVLEWFRCRRSRLSLPALYAEIYNISGEEQQLQPVQLPPPPVVALPVQHFQTTAPVASL